MSREHQFSGFGGACAGCGLYVEETIDARYCDGRSLSGLVCLAGCTGGLLDQTTAGRVCRNCNSPMVKAPPAWPAEVEVERRSIPRRDHG